MSGKRAVSADTTCCLYDIRNRSLFCCQCTHYLSNIFEMSTSKNVSEVNKQLEIDCGKSEQADSSDAVMSTSNENVVPLKDAPIQTDKIQVLENVVVPNIGIEQKPTAGSTVENSTVVPVLEPRVVESNALKMIAQYGSDSGSSEDEYETESSDDVVEVILDKTISDGNYRVVDSDSEERYIF